MNALRNALRDIRKQRPVGTLPSETAILQSPANSSWSGMTADGRSWMLKKNSNDSYNAEY